MTVSVRRWWRLSVYGSATLKRCAVSARYWRRSVRRYYHRRPLRRSGWGDAERRYAALYRGIRLILLFIPSAAYSRWGRGFRLAACFGLRLNRLPF
ncbi:hypothetical protein KCP70_11225 [Salmonella enterica subsp. enterica]|nr:hypothetical protein KCP70_11225 [Salmonella enterica subsp. enterica]